MANENMEQELVVPTLTLSLEEPAPAAPDISAAVEEQAPPAQTYEPAPLEMSNLTPEEQKIVEDFSEKIDLNNAGIILQYGAASQKKIAGFSETALNNVRTKDLGEVGNMISDLVVELKGFSYEGEKKGFMGLFQKGRNQLESIKAGYTKAEVNVNRIVELLEGHQVTLMKDITMLDKLYEMNLVYFKELTMYILAGKKKLEKERATTLVELTERAQKSGLAEDAQAANDYASKCDRFEKKLHDLELTRMISVQMSPQIRLIQNNDTLMTEKIQSTIVNTIPLWKSQMVIALGLAHSRQAMEAQREVTNVTNDLLRKNAEALKMGTLETAKEAERGVVDIETLRHTNEMLISTLDEVQKIQQQGREKRRAAETELANIEGQLKQKLLDIRG